MGLKLAGALYIHSASEPYNEEQVLSQERVDNWLGLTGLYVTSPDKFLRAFQGIVVERS